MTHLSVNLNKVALLRNQRDCGYPSVLGTAKRVIAAGAHGITVHPRPDERHVRKSDVYELADYLETRPDIEFNIEGYPTHDFLDMVCNVRCHQVTLVPDAPDQKTSDHGWDIRKHKDFLKDIVARINKAGKRVSLPQRLGRGVSNYIRGHISRRPFRCPNIKSHRMPRLRQGWK